MSTPERENIGVIGTGYVGLVTAVGFADLGSEVWCIDIDAAKIDRLNRGEVPIFEPGLEDAIERNRERLHFSTNLADALDNARLLFVAVGTPPTYSGDADLSAVHAVVAAMPPSDRHALVMKSTVPVGTGDAIKRVFREQGKEGFRYVSCPEFLKEGSALSDFLAPDRVVVGDGGDWAGDAVVDLYRPLLNAAHGGSGLGELVRTDVNSAEMVKLAANAFLATKISFINEIANVCEETGADVVEVARGMGLDERIGPKFLMAGIGFGGSCLVGDETVLVRHHGRPTLLRFEDLWRRLEIDHGESDAGYIEPDGLEVLSWDPDTHEPVYRPVMIATRRRHVGEIVDVRTKMGRRIRCTPDHPWFVSDSAGDGVEIKLAEDLDHEDWLPLALERESYETGAPLVPAGFDAIEASDLDPNRVLVRRVHAHLEDLVDLPHAERARAVRGGTSGGTAMPPSLRFGEEALAGAPPDEVSFSTAANGSGMPALIALDERFWRVAGLYLAEGNAYSVGHRHSLQWSFHPTREEHLVDEIVAYWLRYGVAAVAGRTPTAHIVKVHSRLITAWWRAFGFGRTCYEQRLPDRIWEAPRSHKWALLAGLFEGDGSWSLVNGGPSVVIEFGTVSDELADGVMRLLSDVGIVARKRVGRGAKSTKDTHWLRISGAAQVRKALALVPARDRPGVRAAISLQQKETAPTGYQRSRPGTAWARVVSTARTSFDDFVYSLEVTGTRSFVATDSVICHNCFPKDVNALKQLAGNSGYHFQLLNSVIEVNELQKRRVIGKLEKHLGSLVGRRIALLGLAFKPNTDDMRDASSLVLSARLQAAGAFVVAYDPVAEDEARHLMHGVEFADDALDAAQGADAVVLVTEWDEFKQLDLAALAGAMKGDVLIDGRNALDPAAAVRAGLRYEGIGRPAPAAA